MKKVSNSKKKKVNKEAYGFTLVELLAVILILSIISSVVIYLVTDVFDNANDKSYQVTINNIEKYASNYVLDDISSDIWINDTNSSYQYQCVTVQNLIDAGYFKSDVLDSKVDKNTYVQADNYIYLERNIDTKAVTKNILLVGSASSYVGLCSNIKTDGNIRFKVIPDGWSHEKEITIYYNLYNNFDSVSNYKYEYDYVLEDDGVDKSLSKNFTDIANQEDVTVSDNGTLIATIKDKDGSTIVTRILNITEIDNEPPVVEISSTNNVADKQTVTLNMDDMGGSGVDKYYFGKENPEVTDVEWIDVTDNDKVTTTDVVDSEGTWYLGAKDVLGNEVVVSKKFYKTTLSINNGSVTPSEIITMEGTSFTIPDGVADAYYSFDGWYTSSSYSGSKITMYEPLSNGTLYGKTLENVLTGGVVSISGDVIYGETLTASITEDTIPVADKYTYQWYTNTSKSISGGTIIDGATSDNIGLTGEHFGKYIYVIVTATKNNYRSTTFGIVTAAKVGKRSITVTAGSSSKEYDGSALTNSNCTGSNLVSGDTVSCTMTSASKRTNYGSTDNIINTVSITNSSDVNVTSYYNVTKVKGTLTITDSISPTITFGTDGSNDKWIKTASSTITVADAASGVDTTTLKYAFSTSKTFGVKESGTAFVNRSQYKLEGENGTYYLHAYACDNAGNCTTKVSNPFKLDNIPPVVTCKKSGAGAKQYYNNDQEWHVLDIGDEYNQSYLLNDSYKISYVEDCSIFYSISFSEGSININQCSSIFSVSDNSNSIGTKTCKTVYYDEDGHTTGVRESDGASCIIRGTSCNCVKGYCNQNLVYTVDDSAGNKTVTSFNYYFMYENASSLRSTYCNSGGTAKIDKYVCNES